LYRRNIMSNPIPLDYSDLVRDKKIGDISINTFEQLFYFKFNKQKTIRNVKDIYELLCKGSEL